MSLEREIPSTSNKLDIVPSLGPPSLLHSFTGVRSQETPSREKRRTTTRSLGLAHSRRLDSVVETPRIEFPRINWRV